MKGTINRSLLAALGPLGSTFTPSKHSSKRSKRDKKYSSGDRRRVSTTRNSIFKRLKGPVGERIVAKAVLKPERGGTFNSLEMSLAERKSWGMAQARKTRRRGKGGGGQEGEWTGGRVRRRTGSCFPWKKPRNRLMGDVRDKGNQQLKDSIWKEVEKEWGWTEKGRLKH